MYAVVGATTRATATLGGRVVEELLTRVTGDEIAFVVADPEAVAGYRNRNVDIRRAAPGDTAATDRATADAEVVLLLREPAPDLDDADLDDADLRSIVAAAVDRAVEEVGTGLVVEVPVPDGG